MFVALDHGRAAYLRAPDLRRPCFGRFAGVERRRRRLSPPPVRELGHERLMAGGIVQAGQFAWPRRRVGQQALDEYPEALGRGSSARKVPRSVLCEHF